MSEVKHTPGPWRACGKDRKGCTCGQVWSQSADHPVATVVSGKWGDTYPAIRLVEGNGMIGQHAEAYAAMIEYGEVADEEAKANARLIAAAPDLLKELRHLVCLLEPLEHDGSLNVPGLATLNGARSAIAKAEPK